MCILPLHVQVFLLDEPPEHSRIKLIVAIDRCEGARGMATPNSLAMPCSPGHRRLSMPIEHRDAFFRLLQESRPNSPNARIQLAVFVPPGLCKL
jgi:hypothetical protein